MTDLVNALHDIADSLDRLDARSVSNGNIVVLRLSKTIDPESGEASGALNATWQEIYDYIADGKLVLYNNVYDEENERGAGINIITSADYSFGEYACWVLNAYGQFSKEFTASDSEDYVVYRTGSVS